MDNRAFFNKVAFDWDQMCRHDAKKLRKIIELTSIKAHSKILDVGTGTGILISYLLETSPYKVVAVDIAENMVLVASEKYKNDRVEFVVKDVMDFNEKGFDYIFLYSVYPHFVDKDALFYHLSKLINSGGKIVVAHSESKEKINAIHAASEHVKEHRLPAADTTSKLMAKYFIVDRVIDTDEMYYVSGIKK
ncbi:MAG: hypothetical protein PWP27_2384 [Clostridiales bacterium]|jgi:demethylmenaquinone methyltransferase/2-methoxy-6-polyprenyl-1,4-benzoquinol methylase|nr:hypothetical protein [Clostridiales bacterium]